MYMGEDWDNKCFPQPHCKLTKIYESILIFTQNTITTVSNQHNSQYPAVTHKYRPIY